MSAVGDVELIHTSDVLSILNTRLSSDQRSFVSTYTPYGRALFTPLLAVKTRSSTMPPAQIARLVYSASNGEKYEADIEREETSIGRRDDNQICLFDGLISKYHAIIRKEDDGKYYIRDKNSANGIRINEKTIEPAKMILLNNNDMIEIGPFPLIFF
jgi:pSer/pThr/pTyr-binding forkhead associated (FHA) protein